MSIDKWILYANQAMVAFTLGVGSVVWQRLRQARVTVWMCDRWPDLPASRITATMHFLGLLMPLSYVLFVGIFENNDGVRRFGTLFYQAAILYLLWEIAKEFDRPRLVGLPRRFAAAKGRDGG